MSNKAYRDAFVSAHLSDTIAAQISMLRGDAGWTQQQLAKKAGMKQSRISALESSEYKNYEVETLLRLASAFDVALSVRFQPFSELVKWSASVSPEKLLISSYKEDEIVDTGLESNPGQFFRSSTTAFDAFVSMTPSGMRPVDVIQDGAPLLDRALTLSARNNWTVTGGRAVALTKDPTS